MIRADFLFTFWVIFWYVFYLTGYFKQSPKLSFYLLLLVNLFILVSMIFKKMKARPILYFILIIAGTNLLPLLTLYDATINKADLLATVGLFVMFIGWLLWEDKIHLLEESYMAMLQSQCSTPMMCGLTKFFS